MTKEITQADIDLVAERIMGWKISGGKWRWSGGKVGKNSCHVSNYKPHKNIAQAMRLLEGTGKLWCVVKLTAEYECCLFETEASSGSPEFGDTPAEAIFLAVLELAEGM